MAAALAAAQSGARVVLIDEQPALGGRLRHRVATISGLDRDLDALPGVRLAEELAGRVVAAGVEVVTSGVAWGLFEDHVLGVMTADASYQLQARAIVVATGSTDIVAPFPGGSLPGVLTATATQIFLHVHRVLPGLRFAVVGAGPEAEEVAGDIALAGAEVIVRVEPPDAICVSGSSQVECVETAGTTYEVDAVALALGRQPDPELALQAQVDIGYATGVGTHVPFRSDVLETSCPGLYVAGDAAGIVSVAEAMAEGRLAGLAAAGAEPETIERARAALDGLRSSERRAAVARLRLPAPAR